MEGVARGHRLLAEGRVEILGEPLEVGVEAIPFAEQVTGGSEIDSLGKRPVVDAGPEMCESIAGGPNLSKESDIARSDLALLDRPLPPAVAPGDQEELERQFPKRRFARVFVLQIQETVEELLGCRREP